MNYSLKVGESRMELSGLKEPIAQAYEILHWGFTIAPILAGADKFFHLLCDWDKYLAPQMISMLAFSGHTFMQIVGVIEIVAGIGVMLLPRIFAYVVSAWLVGIILNLLIAGAKPVRYSSIMWTSSADTVRRKHGSMISGDVGLFK